METQDIKTITYPNNMQWKHTFFFSLFWNEQDFLRNGFELPQMWMSPSSWWTMFPVFDYNWFSTLILYGGRTQWELQAQVVARDFESESDKVSIRIGKKFL